MRQSIWDGCAKHERRRIGDDDTLIRICLPIAEGRVAPTRAGIDEPKREAEQREERARVRTTRLLLAIYRDQIEAGQVDERLRRFFAEQAEQRIWPSRDLFGAMPNFIGRPRRGAPKRYAARDFFLAAEIQELRDTGKTINEACLDLFERMQCTAGELDPRTLRNLYLRETKHPVDKAAVEAMVWLNQLDRSESR